MVNGNYVLYGDRPSSESEIVDDHVQTRTTERKTKRKANRTANELQQTLNLAQLDNETDSVKYEKKIKEPRLLRYVPTTDVEQNFVTENFETYDLKPTVERPRKYNFVKKPRNPLDGSTKYAYSRSNSSSPNGNLPTISEHCEQYGTYRMNSNPGNHDLIAGYESKLEKYFTKPRDIPKFTSKVDYNGSHPDSLYRVPPPHDGGAGGGRVAHALRMARWPAALLLVCVALAGFVYFLMPGPMGSDLELVNSTFWDNNILTAGVGARGGKVNDTVAHPTTELTKAPDTTTAKIGKTPEIDFYDPDIDFVALIDKAGEKSPQRNLPAPPVFPAHIAPEVQYGNENADTRSPKVLEKVKLTTDSTVKPHITLKPEKPLAVYFKDAATESIARAETINDLSNGKQTTKLDESKRYQSRPKQPTYEVSKTRQHYAETELPPEFQEFYRRPSHGDVPLTSGHSKFFGIGIEDIDKMTSSTTQSSLYNTRVSPTLPTWRDGDDATTKHYTANHDVPQCQSPRLPLCRGALPYDLAGKPPTIDGKEMAELMPQIEYLISTNCSARMRQYLCAILEPECSPKPYPPKLPCYNFCKAMVDSCEGQIPRELTTAFKCKQYAVSNCADARAPCSVRELQCDDATCVPRDWMCDGKRDCPRGDDEAQCVTCDNATEFRCNSGSCILKRWVCDGYRDCQEGEDEDESACEILKDTFAADADALVAAENSAPAPSVTKPDRHRTTARKTAKSQADSSQELLITSDTNNALKRNFTRRPSTSRLTPYVPKVRTQPQTHTHSHTHTHSDRELDDKPFKSTKTTRRRQHKTTTPITTTTRPESVEDVNLGDLGFSDELQKDPKLVTDHDFKLDIDDANSKPDIKKQKNVSPTQQKYTQKTYERERPASAEDKPAVRFDKTSSNYERVIDGSALIKQAAKEAALEAAEPENTTSYEEEFPTRKGSEKRVAGIATSHTSPCPSGELRCVDGRCITLAQLCDGTIDCSDHADEDNCYT